MHYYATQTGADETTVKNALVKVTKKSSNVIIAVPGLDNLENNAIRDGLGKENATALKTKHVVSINSVQCFLMTKKITPVKSYPILAIYVSIDQISSIVNQFPNEELYYVAWTPAERDSFCAKFPYAKEF
jgi:hypothetical protein